MKTCFIIMPLSTPENSLDSYGGDLEHFLHVLECLFIPAVEACNLRPLLPLVAGSDIIHGEIIKNLSSADLVLCDISQLNPNVFFEFGIRTALNKPVALVTDDATATIPFDTGIINYHRYNSSLQGWLIKSEVGKLSEHIQKTLESEPDRNSLWKYFGIAQTGFFNADQATTEDKIALVLRKLDSITAPYPSFSSKVDLSPNDNLPPYQEALAAFQKHYIQRLLSTAEALSISALAEQAGVSSKMMGSMLEKLRRQEKVSPDDDA